MIINIKYSNLESTPALETYINEKIGALDKFLSRWETDGDLNVFVEVGRITQHHHKGPVYKAEVNLQLPGKLVRVERENWDVRVAVDEVKNVLGEILSQHNQKNNPR
ncbi:MAG: ribosome-associated translation inhibitor RaiA [bacterium]|nr:ribosome-associated translation inhibitor RaiA [bacterium]